MLKPLIVYNYNELGEPIHFIRFINKSRTLYRTSFINHRFNRCFRLLDEYIQFCLKRDVAVSEVSIVEYAKFGFGLLAGMYSEKEQETLPSKFVDSNLQVKLSQYIDIVNIIKASGVLIQDRHNWRKLKGKNVDMGVLLLLDFLKDYGETKFECVFGLSFNNIKLEEFIDELDVEELDHLMDNLYAVKHLLSIKKEFYSVYLACGDNYEVIVHEVCYK